MTEANIATTERPKLGIRTGSSRKLLARKAVEKAAEGTADGESLEASFPSPADSSPAAGPEEAALIGLSSNDSPPVEQAATPLADDAMGAMQASASATDAAPAPAGRAAPNAPVHAQAWSAEDESAFQTLLTRRKAAGYQRRGRDVGGQVITAGTIKPNPGTVVAVIVGIVAARGGSVGRGDLVDAMATAHFPHAKAQPSDKGWCQGYVAGAIRNGFLTLMEQAAVTAQAS